MVTGAVWADVTGDRQKELIIVGEWMSPKIFSFKGDHFEEVKTNLGELKGWWGAVSARDLDGDGREDLILGNIGENFYLHPEEGKPVKLWMNDFDQNGTMDKILTRTVEGRDMPVFLKREMEEQLPVLKKQNLHHRDYATRSVKELFSAGSIDKSMVKQFNYASSCIAWNEGEGKFRVEKLPAMVQLSSINALECADVNGDGRMDLITAGNRYGFPPQFGRLDGSYGDLLLNEGKRNFSWVEPGRSGLMIRGEVRDIEEVNEKGSSLLLFLVNDEYPKLYEIRHKKQKTNSK